MLVVVIAIIIVGLAATSFLGFAQLDSFKRVDDGERLIAQAIHDQGDRVLWSAAREQRDAVTVYILLYRPSGHRQLLALRSNVEVTLSAPLGERPVFDATGQRVPEVR